MPVNPTPCSECTHFTELRDPQPGCSWNRCSHPKRRLETKYPCPLNSYGYASKKCEYFSESIIPVAIRPNFTPIKESTTITAVYFMDELIAFFRMLFGLKPSVERIQSKCNHVFAPEKDESGKFIGQRCPICDKFNSMKDLGMEEDDT